jgi:hypothetical protein
VCSRFVGKREDAAACHKRQTDGAELGRAVVLWERRASRQLSKWAQSRACRGRRAEAEGVACSSVQLVAVAGLHCAMLQAVQKLRC